jgi:fatty acid desaturase
MKKKDLFFTFGLTLFMGILWIAGEVVMGLWLAVPAWGHIAWMAGIVVVTLIISVWHSLMEDESGRRDPKTEKYERKVNKRRGIVNDDEE